MNKTTLPSIRQIMKERAVDNCDAVFEEFVRQFSPTETPSKLRQSSPSGNVAPSPPAPIPLPAPRLHIESADQYFAGRRERELQARTTVHQAKQQVEPLFLRTPEAAVLLGISVSTFQRLVREGYIVKPRLLSPRRVGWLMEDLHAYVRQLPEADLLCPPNTGWLKTRDGRRRGERAQGEVGLVEPIAPPLEHSTWPFPNSDLTSPPAPAGDSVAAGAASTVAAQTPKARTKASNQDRDGFRARPGFVYRLPGTQTIWHKRFSIEVKKEFSAVVASGERTWAEMQLTGDDEHAALKKLRQHGVSYLAAADADADSSPAPLPYDRSLASSSSATVSGELAPKRGSTAGATLSPGYIVGSRRDRTGELPRLGGVYRVPGTDTLWHKRHDAGAISKPFAIAINRDGSTWAEMELTGADLDKALTVLRCQPTSK